MTWKFIALPADTPRVFFKQNQFMSPNEGLDKKLPHGGIKFPKPIGSHFIHMADREMLLNTTRVPLLRSTRWKS